MTARATSSGTISFGLVSIPVKFYTAAASEQVRFNMLHGKCGGRLKQQLYCPVEDEVVARTDVVKGYEFSKGEFVRFANDELTALEAQRDSSINIVEFVDLDCFDLIQIEKSYYLGPDRGGDKAYRLLSASMTESKKVAVGTYSARGKEQLVVIRPYQDGLLFHQLYYADEVRSFEDVDRGATFEFHPAEKQLAALLIEQLTSDTFEPGKYADSFRTRVLAAVEQKVAGKKIEILPEAPRAQIIDLFEALKQSLEGAGTKGRERISGEDRPMPLKKAESALLREESDESSTG